MAHLKTRRASSGWFYLYCLTFTLSGLNCPKKLFESTCFTLVGVFCMSVVLSSRFLISPIPYKHGTLSYTTILDDVFIHTYIWGHREAETPEVNSTASLLFHLVIWDRICPWTWDSLMSNTYLSSRDLPVSVPSSYRVLKTHATMPGFYVDTQNPSSGSLSIGLSP